MRISLKVHTAEMEQLRNCLDSESYQRLVGKYIFHTSFEEIVSNFHYSGIKCRLPGCQMFVVGDEQLYKKHLKSDHDVRCSKRNNIPLACADCQVVFRFYKHFRKHIFDVHQEPILMNEVMSERLSVTDPSHRQSSPVQFDFAPDSDGPENVVEDITNPMYYCNAVDLTTLRNEAVEFATKLRCDVSLPESKLKDMMTATTNLLNSYQVFVLGKLKQFVTKMGICENDGDFVSLVNSLELNDPFVDVKTPGINLSYLAYKSDGSVPTVQEIVLGSRKIIKRVPHRSTHLKFGRRIMMRNSRTIKDVAHYIPVDKILELVMRNPEARACIQAETEQAEVIGGFKDGSLFKTQPIFKNNPSILRLLLHSDEVEYLNPLGSRKGKKKLTNISLKVQNFDPIVNSTLDRIYLTLTVSSNVLKKYGYAKVLQPLLNDLKTLEKGIPMVIGEFHYNLQAVLVNVVGDTAALHEIFNIMGPQSKLFCRICYISRDDFRGGHFGAVFPHRTPESIQSDLESIRDLSQTKQQCGLIEECCLNEIGYFNYGKDKSMDPMHDLCEGVNMMIIKLILRNLVTVRKILSCELINQSIDEFDYGVCEVENKPSSNFSLRILNSRTNSIPQSASQCWLLLRAFPYMFHKFISVNPDFVKIIGVLLQINYFSFSNKFHLNEIPSFELAIQQFYQLFRSCFPNTNPINKIHHLSHYPELILMNGSLINCFAFEAKFKISKGQSKTCNNFKNLTYSIATRTNLKQVDSIIKHNYKSKVHTVISSLQIAKSSLQFAIILFDLPPTVTTISHLIIDSTCFRPGVVVKYEVCDKKQYGIIEGIISLGEEFIFIIQKLIVLKCNVNMYSLEAIRSDELSRVSSLKICTRKAYSLWKRSGVDDSVLYISLKYYDD